MRGKTEDDYLAFAFREKECSDSPEMFRFSSLFRSGVAVYSYCMDAITRESFRFRLLKYFGLIIIILTISSGFTLYQAFRTNFVSNIMFRKLFTTSSLTIRMGTVHQNLKNYINYENEELLPVFTESLGEFVSSFEEAQREIIGDSLTTENQSLYYKFMDIKKMVNDYSDSSLALVKDADFANRKFNIFDSFYELEKLKDFIYLSQTDLIFRQMVSMETFFEKNSAMNNRIFLALLSFTLILILISLFAAYRFSGTLTSPVMQLVEQAKGVSRGLFRPIELTVKTSSEISILVETFNHMVDEIKEQIAKLKEKAHLEKKLMAEEVKLLKMENALNQSELLYLQSQMNPHFLFNTINTISVIADIEEAFQTREMLDNMSVILRYNLKHAGTNSLLKDEMNVIDNYLNIQKKRFGERIRFEREIDSSYLDWTVPAMIVQPLVENALIHGLEPKEDKGTLRITLSGEDGALMISVRDDGMGISEETLRQINESELAAEEGKKQHLGVKNVIRRLELSYHRKCLFFSSIEGVGTEAKIILPRSLD